MKILTKEEEDAHYNATLKGGITGGFLGLAVVRLLPTTPLSNLPQLTPPPGRLRRLRSPPPFPPHPQPHAPHESLPRLLQRHFLRHHLRGPHLARLRTRTQPREPIPRSSIPRARGREGQGGHPPARQGLGPGEPILDCVGVVGGVHGRGDGAGVAE